MSGSQAGYPRLAVQAPDDDPVTHLERPTLDSELQTIDRYIAVSYLNGFSLLLVVLATNRNEGGPVLPCTQ